MPVRSAADEENSAANRGESIEKKRGSQDDSDVEGVQTNDTNNDDGNLSVVFQVPPSMIQGLNLEGVDPGTVLNLSNIQQLSQWISTAEIKDGTGKNSFVLKTGVGSDNEEEDGGTEGVATFSVNPNIVMAANLLQSGTSLSRNTEDSSSYSLPVEIIDPADQSSSLTEEFDKQSKSNFMVTGNKKDCTLMEDPQMCDFGFTVPKLTEMHENLPSNNQENLERDNSRDIFQSRREWTCSLCNISFTSDFYLQSHNRLIHDQTRSLPSKADSLSRMDKIADIEDGCISADQIIDSSYLSQDMSTKCLFCNEMFPTRSDLGNHVTSNHLYNTADSTEIMGKMGLALRWKDFVIENSTNNSAS